MQVNKAELVKALNTVKPCITNKGDDDFAGRVLLAHSDVVGFDGTQLMAIPLDTQVVAGVPFEEFHKILTRMSADIVDLALKDGLLHIKGGKARAKLKVVTEGPYINDAYGILERTEGAQWGGLPADYLTAVRLCMYSASKDQTQKHLQCVYTRGTLVTASDDFRISRYTIGEEMPEFLVMARHAANFTRLPFDQWCMDDKWVFFVDGETNAFYGCFMVNVQYEETAPYFDFDGHTFTFPDNLSEAIETAGVMAGGETDLEKEVMVTGGNGRLVIKGEKDLGMAEVEVPATIGSNFAFRINPFFLLDVLQRTNEIYIGADRSLFKDGQFQHLIALSRG